jgi:uncharacterized protein YbcI
MPGGAGPPPDRRCPASDTERDGTESAWRHEPDRRKPPLRHPVTADESTVPGPTLAEVTNAIVRLHREHYGKGPTRSKSYVMDDVLVCVMQDVLTTVERTLVEAGEEARVRDTRFAFQEAMRGRFVEAVERIMGRPVLGVTSQILVTRDVAIELFLLGPASAPPGGEE